MLNLKLVLAMGATGFALCACQPAAPPPDIIKTQREALEKSKAVEGVLQQSQERTKSAEDAQK